MSAFDSVTPVPSSHHHDKHKTPGSLPETQSLDDGSAKRNIVRRREASRKHKGNNPKMAVNVDDGSNYVEDGGALDEYDPNYDSEADEYIGGGSPTRAPVVEVEEPGVQLNSTQYKKVIQPIIDQYFLSGEVDELRNNLFELNLPQFSYEFVKKAMTMSMDRSDRERELVSKMFSEFYPDVLSTNMIGKGFERLFEIIDELSKDAPAAKEITATFIARCVVDEILPPSFLSDVVVFHLGGDIIDHAKRMLSREHMGARLERVWGPGDGRPVREMKVAVDLLLQEYILSRDQKEAIQCVKQLHAPHFYHEVVKRAILSVLDKNPEDRVAMHDLIRLFSSDDVISSSQIIMGYQLAAQRIPDIALDVPNAKGLFEELLVSAKADNLLPADFEATVVSTA